MTEISDVIEAMARALADAKIHGQRQRFSDEYASLMIREALRAAEALGWKLCPRYPTEEMDKAWIISRATEPWPIMWNASPKVGS